MKQNIETKQNPRLCQREMKDGRISLYLEYYMGRTEQPVLDEEGNPIYYEGTNRPKYKVQHIRKKEALNIYLHAKPRTPKERQENKDNIDIANQVRASREEEMRAGKLGYRVRVRGINFLDFLDEYDKEYSKTDFRVVSAVIARFKAFLTEFYPREDKVISPQKITPDMMEKFSDYLQSKSRGEGGHAYYGRWKRICKFAVRKDILQTNPCDDIRCGVTEDTLKKDILSQEEIKMLVATTYEKQNKDIRRAFLFSLYAGLRYCDVKDLKYSDVDYSNQLLIFTQNKTEGHSKASTVTIPLNKSLLKLIGKSKGSSDTLIFKLPSHTACLKSIKHWVEKAGITKHITWHCARHSFAMNILTNGANIKVVSDLLGHSSLKHTEKYVRALDDAKQNAINSLPELDV